MDDSEITKIGDFSRLNAGEFKMAWDGDLSYVKASRDGINVDTGLKYASISWKTLQALQEVLGGQYPLRCVTINGEHDFRGYLGKLSCDRCGKTRRQILGDYLADKEVEEEAEKAAGEHFAKAKSEIWPKICATPRSQPLPESPKPLYYPEEIIRNLMDEEFVTQLNKDMADYAKAKAEWARQDKLRQELEDRERFCCEQHRARSLRSRFWRGVLFGILALLVTEVWALYMSGCRLEIPYEPSQRQPTRSLDHVVPLGESVAEVPDR
jgi:hypothetical protein